MGRFSGIDITISRAGEMREQAAARRLDELLPRERALAEKRILYSELWTLAVAASLFREHDWLRAFEFRIQMEFELDGSNHWAPRVTGNAYVTECRRPGLDSATARIGAPLLHKDDVDRLYLRQFDNNIYAMPKTWCNSLARDDFGDLLNHRHLKASMLWERLNPPAPTASIIPFSKVERTRAVRS